MLLLLLIVLMLRYLGRAPVTELSRLVTGASALPEPAACVAVEPIEATRPVTGARALVALELAVPLV
jgi:hypothetical protein